MQAVFEYAIRQGDTDQMLRKNIEQFGEENVDGAFAALLLEKTITNWDAIIESLGAHAPQWPLNRMDPVSRAILLMSACELLYLKDAPPAVVMDEGIEIAKEYGSPESAKFVNGVLNAIAHH